MVRLVARFVRGMSGVDISTIKKCYQAWNYANEGKPRRGCYQITGMFVISCITTMVVQISSSVDIKRNCKEQQYFKLPRGGVVNWAS